MMLLHQMVRNLHRLDVSCIKGDQLQHLVDAAERMDQHTVGHSLRVAHYSVLTAQALGIDEEDIEVLSLGAWLHDVGKIGIETGILDKPGRLNDEEMKQVRYHSLMGMNLLAGYSIDLRALDIVRHHHELLDGSGYPDCLIDDEICELVRIVTVADIFDAMTTKRSYREALSVEIVLEHLLGQAEQGQLDAKVVRNFANTIYREGVNPMAMSQAVA